MATATKRPRAEGMEITDSKRKEIQDHVTALKSFKADKEQEAAKALALARLASYSAANCAAIAAAGGIPLLVALVANGAAGSQKMAAWALVRLAYDDDIRTAIAAAGAIAPLVALVTNGAAGGQEQAAGALRTLAYNNAANKAAIVAAGGVEALSALLANGSDFGKEYARRALEHLGPLAEYASRLQSENASLKRQLAGDDVVDLRDDGAPPPAKKRNALRDAHDEQQSSTLNRVKEEKTDAEGARDRNDAVAAAASTAAATAAADAREAAREAAQELEDVHDDFVNPLTLTVNALQTKIDELHALASQVDPVAADAIKNRPN